MPINWTTHIPEDPRGQSFPLKRTPPNGKLVAAITSENLIGTDTHFYGGHTIPCERPECEACKVNMPFRFHAYVSALEAKTHLHFLFEFTKQAAQTFKQYFKAHGTLRGCLFEATRLHARVNGRVILFCKPLDQQKFPLPDPPNIAACMAIIWNIPIDQIQTNKIIDGHPAMTNTQQTLGKFNGARAQPKKILDPV